MTRFRSLALAALLVAGAWGCTESTYTEPEYISATVSVAATLRNAAGEPTLIVWEATLDGLPLGNGADNPPVAQALVGGSLHELSAGTHVLTVRVVRQTASPSRYLLENVRVSRNAPNSQTFSEVAFYPVSIPATLAEGDSVSYTLAWR